MATKDSPNRGRRTISLLPEVEEYVSWLGEVMGEVFSTKLNTEYMRRLKQDKEYQDWLAAREAERIKALQRPLFSDLPEGQTVVIQKRGRGGKFVKKEKG